MNDIRIRHANQNDALRMLKWRNMPEIRAFFFNSDEVTKDDHLDWFSRSLVNKNRIIFIIENNNRPAGVLRFDLNENEAEIDIYIIPDEQGKGIAKAGLNLGVEWLKTEKSHIHYLAARILTENVASSQLFLSQEFSPYYACLKKKIVGE